MITICCFVPQVPPDYTYPMRESRSEMNGFAVTIRYSNLRFQLNKTSLVNSGPYVHLKCVARIDGLPTADKEGIVSFYVPALEKTRNHVSAHHRSAGEFINFLCHVSYHR